MNLCLHFLLSPSHFQSLLVLILHQLQYVGVHAKALNILISSTPSLDLIHSELLENTFEKVLDTSIILEFSKSWALVLSLSTFSPYLFLSPS